MPPKQSQALVNRGVSGLAKKQGAGGVARTGRHGAHDPREKQTTSLVLRGGQQGIWGTGEIMLKGGHYSGPQKLAARASVSRVLVAFSNSLTYTFPDMLITSGLLPPFNFSQLLNIAWAQCDRMHLISINSSRAHSHLSQFAHRRASCRFP